MTRTEWQEDTNSTKSSDAASRRGGGVDGGVDGEAAGVEAAGVGTWPFGAEEREGTLLVGEEVGIIYNGLH